jgi:hypothetical protein
MAASSYLIGAFILLTLVTAAASLVLFHLGSKRRRTTLVALLLLGGWLAATYAAAARGLVRFEPRPPTFFLFVATALILTILLGFSRLGRILATTVPLAALVGLQAFRLPLELLMHRALEEGIMPVQMSYTGRNFDIVTGATAIIVAIIAGVAAAPLRRRVVTIWNVMGFLLLANIVTIAIVSTPTPLRLFHNEPPNVWVTHPPFVWLAVFFVPLALLGHILIFRRLKEERAAV